jgi:glycosyltransferase involved in cell wall biosynthesis
VRIAVVTRDPTGPELGGNAMRATELARALGAHGEVTLLAPGSAPPAPVAHAAWDPDAPRTLRPLLAGADAVVSTPQSPEATAELRRSGARLVLDLYDPFPLAALEAHAGATPWRRRFHTMLAGDSFLEGMRAAHHLICASERQRDLWLGALLAAGLLRPETYDADPTLRSRIDVVPIGVPAEPPTSGSPLRERLGLAPRAAGAASGAAGSGSAGDSTGAAPGGSAGAGPGAAGSGSTGAAPGGSAGAGPGAAGSGSTGAAPGGSAGAGPGAAGSGSTGAAPGGSPGASPGGGSPSAEIVLWYGGLWNWLDPVTPVRAMPALLERRPGAHLAFLGRAPADPGERDAADSARAVARDLGAAGERVHFLDAIAPYAERGAWLTDADCSVTAHSAHLETRFSFRTRMLDFIWAGLPVVSTEGDALSELVARDALGEVVAPGDHEGMAESLARVLERGRDAYAPAFAATAKALDWSRVTAPLVQMISSPEVPPRLGDAALVPALPGPASRALLTRALRGVTRRF